MIAAAQRRRQRHRIVQGAADQQRPRHAFGEAEGESLGADGDVMTCAKKEILIIKRGITVDVLDKK